jgi:hypothetical protein
MVGRSLSIVAVLLALTGATHAEGATKDNLIYSASAVGLYKTRCDGEVPAGGGPRDIWSRRAICLLWEPPKPAAATSRKASVARFFSSLPGSGRRAICSPGRILEARALRDLAAISVGLCGARLRSSASASAAGGLTGCSGERGADQANRAT